MLTLLCFCTFLAVSYGSCCADSAFSAYYPNAVAGTTTLFGTNYTGNAACSIPVNQTGNSYTQMVYPGSTFDYNFCGTCFQMIGPAGPTVAQIVQVWNYQPQDGTHPWNFVTADIQYLAMGCPYTGTCEITAVMVECPVITTFNNGNIILDFDINNNEFYMSVTPRNYPVGIYNITYSDSSQMVVLDHTQGPWTKNLVITPPFSLHLTAVTGETVEVIVLGVPTTGAFGGLTATFSYNSNVQFVSTLGPPSPPPSPAPSPTPSPPPSSTPSPTPTPTPSSEEPPPSPTPGSTPSPTPTPTPSSDKPTPSPTPTPSPALKPAPTPTPGSPPSSTPSPSPSSHPTPTPSPSSHPTPTPNGSPSHPTPVPTPTSPGGPNPVCTYSAFPSCSICGIAVTRKLLAGDITTCTDLDYFCSTNCTFPFNIEHKISSTFSPGTREYALLSFYYLLNNVKIHFLAKYNVTLVLPQDSYTAALSGTISIKMLNAFAAKKRQNTSLPCPTPGVVAITKEQLEKTTKEFLITSLGTSQDLVVMDVSDGCLFSVSIDTPRDTTAIILGVVIGVLCFTVIVLVLGFLWYRNLPANLSKLPKPVRWQYEQAQAHLRTWEKFGSGQNKYYYKRLSRGSDEWENMASLFYDLLEADESLPVSEAYAVYNPTLLSNFVNHCSIIQNRLKEQSEVFGRQDWRLKDINTENRLNVTQNFEERREAMGWNKGSSPVIFATLHGTEFNCAKSICSTGFAVLSSVDCGWYGSGIYFTTHSMYSLPYCSARSDPAIIVSYLCPGNYYPVTEDPKSAQSLSGGAILPGYNSHYVVVNSVGLIAGASDDRKFDEIVISQECQVTPVYVLRFNPDGAIKVLKEWKEMNRLGTDRPRKRSRPGKLDDASINLESSPTVSVSFTASPVDYLRSVFDMGTAERV